MKHTKKITAILISMFFLTQLIGLAVVYSYTPIVEQRMINGTLQNVTINPLPYGMEPPPIEREVDFFMMLPYIATAFIVAILFVFLLTRLKAAMFMRLWFFIVVILVLGITMNAILMRFTPLSSYIALAIALPLAIFKIFKRNMLVHNITELMIYPGIAVVFIPLLNVWTIILLLIAISLYDMWAVWHSGFMQKMAKFQMDELKIFAGFFVPYLTKKQKQKIKKLKEQEDLAKTKKAKPKSMKVSVAILGGGDVVFPIITAGVIMRTLGFLPAVIVSVCATLALGALFYYSKKGKFYPAMPFISAGLFVGIILAYLVA